MTVSKHFVTEKFPQIRLHLARQVHPVIVHCEQNTFDTKLGVECVPHPIHSIHQLRNAFQGEKFALDRNQHRIRGDQRIQRQQIQSRGAVYQNIMIIILTLRDGRL